MLINKLKNLPKKPGVYQYFDEKNHLLYVGKAKNLYNRVRSYFVFKPKFNINQNNSLRIQKMLKECVNLEFITTDSEADALILENSFIKQLRPKYNILLRDDKTYPYIYVDLNEDFPRFNITRKIIKKPKIRYFGPFFKGAKELLNTLYFTFKLRQKSNCKKSCIFYQINRCLAPCEDKIDKKEYKIIIENAINAILNPSILIKNLENKMLFLAQNENFEEAAKIRDSINIIKDLEIKIHIDIAKLEDFNIFALAFKDNIANMVRFVIQNGKIIGANNKIIILKNANIEQEEINDIYKQVILENFASNTPINGNKIYVLHDFKDKNLISNILSKRFAKKISINIAKIGEKKQLCNLAYKNALMNIKNDNNNLNFLKELQNFFDFNNIPQHIEIFDNSHMQGVANVGAMVSFNDNNFNKNLYRHYHLNTTNEYEQMKELLNRRIIDTLAKPDLWVLDGGAILLKLANDIITNYGANIDLIAISKENINNKKNRAKGKAKDILYIYKDSKIIDFKLDTFDKKLLFFQSLRDEAHRFAIKFHQNTKRKLDLQSSKLKKLGISNGEIAKLLSYFGNFDNIYKADFDDIKEITNKNIADKITKYANKL